jgi:hypothetical protein
MKNTNKTLDKVLLERLVYISHPSISNLECSINLYKWSFFEVLKNRADLKLIFYNVASEIIEMTNSNPSQVKINYYTYSILFQHVAAMKLLNLLFKHNKDHALYPIYLKWLEGSEWMSSLS